MKAPHTFTLNCRGKLLSLSSPAVMGILNLTPDSFYDGGKFADEKTVLLFAEQMLTDGASIIDMGGMSSRPGAEIINSEEEVKRLMPYLKAIRKQFPQAIISIDTLHATTADCCLQEGASIINDISAGMHDADMLSTVARHHAVFIAMHMRGTPKNMQQQTQYEDIATDVFDYFTWRVAACRAAGIHDVVIDPGFGFAKTLDQSYELLRQLNLLHLHQCPLLVGVSRKSMLTKLLNITPTDALNATTALHMLCLQQGAQLLRVHDVKEAVEAVKVYEQSLPA